MPTWAESVLNWIGLGAGGGGAFFTFKWVLEWLTGRYDKRADLIDVGTEKLILHLEARVDALLTRLNKVEEDLDLCKQSHAASEQELARLRGILQGTGDARQVAQLIIAEEKRKRP